MNNIRDVPIDSSASPPKGVPAALLSVQRCCPTVQQQSIVDRAEPNQTPGFSDSVPTIEKLQARPARPLNMVDDEKGTTARAASDEESSSDKLVPPSGPRPRAVSDVSHDFGIRSNPWTTENPSTPTYAATSPSATMSFLNSAYPTPETAVYERNMALLDLYLDSPEAPPAALPHPHPHPHPPPPLPADAQETISSLMASLRSPSAETGSLARSASILPTYAGRRATFKIKDNFQDAAVEQHGPLPAMLAAHLRSHTWLADAAQSEPGGAGAR
jgi:hypothetical protein